MPEITIKRPIPIYSFPLFLCLFVLIGFLIDCVSPVNSSALIMLKEGDPPKDIFLPDINGRRINVSENFGSKPVIIVFWKLTMNKALLNYSLDELLFLQKYYESYHDKNGLEIFAVYEPVDHGDVPEEEIASVRNLVETNGIKFPVLIDSEFKVFKEYGVIVLPSTVMVSKAGDIKSIYPSFPLSARSVFPGMIEDLVGVHKRIHAEKAVRKKKEDSRAKHLYDYALQMSKRGLPGQALSALDKSMDLYPDDTRSHNLKGIILWEKGLHDLSMEEFREAISLDKSNISAHLNLAVIFIEKKDYELAEGILQVTPPAEESMRVRAHHLMGVVYMKTNRIDQAINEFEKAYSLFKGRLSEPHEASPSIYSVEISVLHGLSVLYGSKGDHKKSLSMLHKAFHEALGLGHSVSVDHLAKRIDMMIYE